MKFLRQSLISASAITILANIISRILGFFREAVIANYFGTADVMDVFIIAFTVPELIATVIFTALPASIIPYIINRKQDDDKSEFSGFTTGFILFFVVSLLITILILIGNNIILQFLSPGLDANNHELASNIITITSFYVFFRFLESYFRGWLHAKKHYIIPSLSNIVLNIIILLVISLLYGRIYIKSLAMGWLAGSVVLFILNGIMVLKLVYKSKLHLMDSAWISGLVNIFLLVVLVECISLLFPIIDRSLATRYLETGMISGLRYAFILIIIPPGVFAISYNTASLPWISDLIKSGDYSLINQFYYKSVNILLYTIGISALVFFSFSEEIVHLAFERGQYDLNSVILTVGPLRYYALGIIFYSIYIFQMRIYYASKRIIRLAAILFIMLALKILTSILLVDDLGQNGLALSTTIMWIAGFIIMTYDLRYNLRIILALKSEFIKIIINLSVVGLVWFMIKSIWQTDIDANFLNTMFHLGVMVITGLAIYLILGKILRIEIQDSAFNILRSIFKKVG